MLPRQRNKGRLCIVFSCGVAAGGLRGLLTKYEIASFGFGDGKPGYVVVRHFAS